MPINRRNRHIKVKPQRAIEQFSSTHLEFSSGYDLRGICVLDNNIRAKLKISPGKYAQSRIL